MVATLLAAEGYTVVTARNGMEGLQELAGSRPFLVLLDLMMPVMTGWEFRRAQLSLDDPALAQVPVILLSAVHDPAQVARHLRVAEYIQKPVDFDRLLQSIRKLCPASD
jgi:CheY-like chemotaxis protein